MNKNDSRELFTQSATPRAGNSEEIGVLAYGGVGGTVLWPTGTTAGTLVFETAPYSGYTGTWAELFRITFGTANTAQVDAVALAANVLRARWVVDHAGGAAAARVFANLQVLTKL